MIPKRRHLIDRYLRLYEEIEPYIDAACSSFSKGLRHLTMEDLKQECALKLFEVLSTNKRLSDKKDAEITKIFKKSVYNRLRDMYRSYKSEIDLNLTIRVQREDDDSLNGSKLVSGEMSAHDILVHKEWVGLVSNLLEYDIDKELLRLLVEPDDALVRIVIMEQKVYDKRRKSGETLFISEEVTIRQKHYAQRLGISEATLSRMLKKIQGIISRVLRS